MSTKKKLSVSIILSNTILIIIKYEIMKKIKNKKQSDSMGSHNMEVVACFKQGS